MASIGSTTWTHILDEDGDWQGTLPHMDGTDVAGRTILTGPAHGTLESENDGTFRYVPDADYNGTDTFSYQVVYDDDDTYDVTVTLTVDPINDAPDGATLAGSTTEDTVLVGVLPATDVDDAYADLSFSLGLSPAHGSVTLYYDAADSTHKYSYTPDADYAGQDVFTYVITDPDGASATSEIVIDVAAVNDAPTNAGGSLPATGAVAPGGSTMLDLAALSLADVDGQSGTLTLTAVGATGTLTGREGVTGITLTGQGTSTLTVAGTLAALNQFLDKPDAVSFADTTGTPAQVGVSFSDNGETGSGGAQVFDLGNITLGFNLSPEAQDVTIPGDRGADIVGQLTVNDPENDPLVYALDSGPARGTLAFNPDGSFTYTPFGGVTGTDSFTYAVSDGYSTRTGTVTLAIDSGSGSPPQILNEVRTTDEDVALPGDLDAFALDGSGVSFALSVGGEPAHGSVTIAADGSYLYTPDPDYFGSDLFTYVATSGSGASTTGFVDITVTPQPDSPVAPDTTFALAEDGTLSATAPGNDPDGDAVLFAPATLPTHGQLLFGPDGSFTYVPDPDFSGPDSFDYIVSNPDGTATGTIMLNVTPVQDAPVAADLATGGPEDSAVTGQMLAIDVDGDTLTWSLAPGSTPAFGTLSLSPTGSFVYTPDPDAHGTESLTLSVSDGTASDTANLSIAIASVNDAPVAVDDGPVAAREDIAQLIDLAANDSDIDGDALSVTAASALHGSVTLNGDGSVTYLSDPDYYGSDTITYTVSDGNGGTDTASAALDVAPTAERFRIGTDNDDLFLVDGNGGRRTGFLGGDGFDTVLGSSRSSGPLNLGEAQFDSIELFDNSGKNVTLDNGSWIDLSTIGLVQNVNWINGVGGNETVTGSEQADRIRMGAGDDTVYGLGGDDLIVGQRGSDSLFGGAGNDTLRDATGQDLLDGGDGDDLFEVWESAGVNDRFIGGTGYDLLRNTVAGKALFLTGASFDGIEEIDGNDAWIKVSRGAALDLSGIGTMTAVRGIKGGTGKETVTGSEDGDLINMNKGDDTAFGGGGDDILIGHRGDDRLYGGAGNDILRDHSGQDLLDGGAGDDIFEVSFDQGAGDSFVGGTGHDTLRNMQLGAGLNLTGASFDGVEEIDGAGAWLTLSKGGTLDLSSVATLTDVAGIRGANGAETITGSMDDDFINGRGGKDVVRVNSAVSDAIITLGGIGEAIIGTPTGGTDTLQGIHKVMFDDFTLFLDGRNNAPLANADSVALGEDAAQFFAENLFTGNDFDVEGGPLSLVSVTASGGLAASLGAGGVTLDPNGNFESLGLGDTALAQMIYVVTDPDGATATGQVDVTVNGANDAPDANTDTGTSLDEGIAIGNLLANDTDVDAGAQLAVTGLVGGIAVPGGGFALTLASGAYVYATADGGYIYDPGSAWLHLAPFETDIETLSYIVTDEHGASDIGTLTLTITGANQAPIAVDDFATTTQRGFVVETPDGVLANDSGPEPLEQLHVSGVLGATSETRYDVTGTGLDSQIGYVATGNGGGSFVVAEDGSWRFDAGSDFDDLGAGVSRATSITYLVQDPSGLESPATLTVQVTGGSFTPSIIQGASAPSNPTTAHIVDGTFQQIGGVDIVSELFDRLEDFTGFDLDSMFDFDLLDIDLSISTSFSPDPDEGLQIVITENNPDSTALLSGFGDELNLAASYVSGLLNPVIASPLLPVYFGPTFDIDARFVAQLGWDITLPSLGKTAVSQPVEFTLLLPDTVGEFEAFELQTSQMTSFSPTTTLQTVGLGGIDIDAGYGITELSLSDLGLTIGSQNFLGADIDGFLEGFVKLNHEFDILGATGIELEQSLESTVSLDFQAMLDGLVDLGVEDLLDAIKDLVSDPSTEHIRALAVYISKAVTAVANGVTEPIDVGGALLTPSELQTLHDRAQFREFDLWDSDGRGLFELQKPDGTIVQLTIDIIDAVRDATGVTDAVGALRSLTKDGFSPLDGLTIFADLPVGNIEHIEGFENNGQDPADTTPKMGTSEIEVTQTTRLAGVEIDYEKLSPELARLAIDLATEAGVTAAKAQPYLIPIIVGANIAANAAMILSQEAQRTFEEGFTLDADISALALAADVINGFGTVLNGIATVVNTALQAVADITGLPIPTLPLIDEITEADLGTAFDATVDFIAGQIIGVLDTFTEISADVIDALINNDVVNAIKDALFDVADIALDGVAGALSAVGDAISSFGSAIGVDLSIAKDFLGSIAGVVNAGSTGLSDFRALLEDMQEQAHDVIVGLGDDAENGVAQFAELMKDVARGIDLQLNTDFDLIKFAVEAGLDLVQVARFDPDDVGVTYTVDGLAVDGEIGDVAQFFATGGPGDVLEGQAVYAFSGDVDYDYILRLDFVPVLELYGSQLEGKVTIGEDGQEIAFDFDYAALAITNDFGLEELGNLDASELFDDALIELPFGLLEDVADVVLDTVRDNFAGLTNQTSDLDYNEIRLFSFDGVEIPPEMFSQILQDFSVTIDTPPRAPGATLGFNEAAGLQVAGAALLDTLTGALVAVDGQAANLGRPIWLDGGGEIYVDAEGQVAFDSHGQYEHVAVGELLDEGFDYTVLGTDGVPRTYRALVQIAGDNDPVTAVDDFVTMDEDGVLTFNPAGNDTDIDTADIPFLRVFGATADIGEAIVGPTGQFSYTPPADFNGIATITYEVTDDNGATDTGTVTVTVTPVGDAVRAEPDAITLHENGGKTVDVTANDTEVDGQAISILGFSQPSRGLLEQVSPTELRFHPMGEFEELGIGESVVLSADVTVGDGIDAPDTETLTITVTGRNDAPETVTDSQVLAEDTSVTFDPSANDTDVDGDIVSMLAAGGAGHGTVVLNPDGSVTYTPDADYYGNDSFSYTITDGNGGTATGAAEMTVTPVVEQFVIGDAGDNLFEIHGNSGQATGFVGGAGFDTILNTKPGEAIGLSDSTFDGIELLDANGGQIEVKRGRFLDLSAVGTLINAPLIRGNDRGEQITGSQQADVIQGRQGGDILAGAGGNDVIFAGTGNDTVYGGIGDDRLIGGKGFDTLVGGDGDDLFKGGAGNDRLYGGLGDDVFEIDTESGRGDRFFGGDGYDVVRNADPGTYLDLTNTRFDGIEELDAGGGTIIIDRNASLDLTGIPTLTGYGKIRLAHGDETVTLTGADEDVRGLKGFDTAIIAGSIADSTIQILDDGAWQTLNGASVEITGPGGTDTLVGIERVIFDDYTLRLDGRNNAPVASGEGVSMGEDEVRLLTAALLTLNDVDFDGDPLFIADAGSNQIEVRLIGGDLEINGDDRLAHLALGETMNATAWYDVSDPSGARDRATITFAITGENDAPDAAPDSALTYDGVAVTGNVLTNDSDPDTGAIFALTHVEGAAASVGIPVILASGAQITIWADGSYSYDPDTAFNGLGLMAVATDTAQYTITDEHGATGTGTLTVTISGANQAPEDGDEDYAGIADGTLAVTAAGGLLANATDPDAGDLLSVMPATLTGSTGGSFILDADGAFSFDPGTEFNDVTHGDNRATSVTYTVTDGMGGTDTSTLTVTVAGASGAPTREGEARFDAVIDQSDRDAQVVRAVEGKFRQLGGVDIATYLAETLTDATGFDINDLLDFTLIDINKLFTITLDDSGLLNFDITDVEPSNGALAGLTDDLLNLAETGADALTDLADWAGLDGYLPLGFVEFTPIFNADIGLDVEYGWDIDLPTLGKTSIIQPVELDFRAPEQVAAGDAVLLSSGNLVSLAPTTAVETVGIGDVQIKAGHSLPGTNISDIGIAVRSTDLFTQEPNGLAQASLSLDREFDLGETIETMREFALDSVETILSAVNVDLPFDLEAIFETAMALDIGNLVEGVLSGTIDFAPILASISGGDTASIVDAMLELLNQLNSAGEELGEPINVGGAQATAREIWDLRHAALFNEFDGFYDDGTGYFDLEDENGAPVEVTFATIDAVITALGIDQDVDTLVNILSDTGISPLPGMEVKVNAPIGNAEVIEGFSDNPDGSRDMDDAPGVQNIDIRQETKLLELNVDPEAVRQGMIDTFFNAAESMNGANPGAISNLSAMKLAMTWQDQLRDTFEDGFTAGLSLSPVELVVGATNGLIGAINAFGNAMDSLSPDDHFTEIIELDPDEAIDGVDAAIDLAMLTARGAFEAIEPVIQIPAEIARIAIEETLNGLIEVFETGTNLAGKTADAVVALIDGAIDDLDDAASSFTLPLPWPPWSWKPLEILTAAPTAALRLLRDGISWAGDAIDDLGGFVDDLTALKDQLVDFDIGEAFNQGLSDFGGFLKDLARGAELNIDVGFDLFAAELSSALTLIQIASFEPDEVGVTYELGDFTVEAELGEEVAMFATGLAGETLTGTATYAFSGDVDYQYRLRLDIDPTFTMMGVDMSGEFILGDNDPETFDASYALATLGQSSIEDITSGNLPAFFDEALFELPFDFVQNIVEAVAGQLVNSLELPGIEMVDDEFVFFTLEDIEIGVEDFLPIVETFDVTLV